MDVTAGKDLGNESESNRIRRNPDLRFSSSCKREIYKRLSSGEIEQNATPSRRHWETKAKIIANVGILICDFVQVAKEKTIAMDVTAGKDLGNESENHRERGNPDLRFCSGCKREIYKRLSSGEVEQNATPSRRHTALHDLPLEILDMILQKSYLHWILNSTTKHRDEEVIRSLTSVDFCFNQRVTRKRFKSSIWRFFTDFYGKTRKRSAIIRNNRNYLLENIQPNDEFIALLLSLNCITQEQSDIIQRQNSTQDKNSELLYVAESFDEAKFSDFVKCLRQTNQKTVARIIENGGGTKKIELQSRGAECTSSMEESQQLLKKIEDLRNETKPRSHRTDKIISQLKSEGLEILNSQMDGRTVVVWIWCRSQSALEYIQKMYESNQLRDLFFENIQTSLSMVINIDYNQFNRTIVVCAFSISFTQRIKTEVNKDLHLHGVTKLRNEIYILFESSSLPPTVIHVCEDQNPFNLQKEIELTEIFFPGDIRSNEKENCLYVTDVSLYEKCVWKITREEDGGHKIIKWLTIDFLPQSWSVSNDGRFMVLNKFSLMIYGSDAKLIRSIQLPTDIGYPVHAVETSIGNFIILSESTKSEIIMKWWGISELSRDGQMVIRRFIPSNETQQLNNPEYFSTDSDDRLFVCDTGNGRVILLDSDLRWNRILVPTGEKEETMIGWPMRLCYNEEMKQLMVRGDEVNVYSLSWK